MVTAWLKERERETKKELISFTTTTTTIIIIPIDRGQKC